MSIKYVLRQNKLVEEPDIYAASVQIAGSVGLEEIADRIVDQGTTVRRADVLAVLENAIAVCDTMLLDGMRVQLGGLVDLFPKIKGSFEGPTDTYDPARHQADVAAMPGKRIRRTFRENASVEREEAIKPTPGLVQYDGGESAADGLRAYAAGGIGVINGYRLKFDPAKADEGIFFVRIVDGVTTRVAPAQVQRNMPKQLVFLNPTLDGGIYWLEVRTRYTENGELRVGRLDGTIDADR